MKIKVQVVLQVWKRQYLRDRNVSCRLKCSATRFPVCDMVIYKHGSTRYLDFCTILCVFLLCRPEVTHIVTEFETQDQLFRCLKLKKDDLGENCEMLTMTWFTDSMKAGQPVEIEKRHRLKTETAGKTVYKNKHLHLEYEQFPQ